MIEINKDYFEIAKKTVEAACESGVSAVKLQTYTPDTMTIDSDKQWFKITKGHGRAGDCMNFIRKPICRGSGRQN